MIDNFKLDQTRMSMAIAATAAAVTEFAAGVGSAFLRSFRPRRAGTAAFLLVCLPGMLPRADAGCIRDRIAERRAARQAPAATRTPATVAPAVPAAPTFTHPPARVVVSMPPPEVVSSSSPTTASAVKDCPNGKCPLQR